MRINGAWKQCDDGVIRPLITGRVATRDGEWVESEFLIDIGADRTVISASILEQLALPQLVPTEEIGGLGGIADSVLVETRIQLLNEAGSWAEFRGAFTAVTDVTALDISVLGRDITDLFAAIIDRPGKAVCLINQRHRYEVVQD